MRVGFLDLAPERGCSMWMGSSVREFRVAKERRGCPGGLCSSPGQQEDLRQNLCRVWRPPLDEVAVGVVAIVGSRSHPIESSRTVDGETGATTSVCSRLKVVPIDPEGEVNRSPTRARGMWRVLLE